MFALLSSLNAGYFTAKKFRRMVSDEIYKKLICRSKEADRIGKMTEKFFSGHLPTLEKYREELTKSLGLGKESLPKKKGLHG